MLEYDRIDVSEGIDVNKTNVICNMNVIFTITGIVRVKVLSMNHIFAMVVMI